MTRVLRIWPRSLLGRVVLSQVLLIMLAAIGVWETGGWLLHHAVVHEQRRVLAQQARQIAQGYAGAGRVTLPRSLELAYDSAYDGRAFIIVDKRLGPVGGSRFADGIPWERVPMGTTPSSFSIAPFGGVAMPFTHRARTLWVIVTQDESGPGVIVHRVIAQAMDSFAVVILVLLLLFALFDYVLIRSLMGKVARASDEARAIGPGNLAARLDAQGLPSEVAPLVRALNELLDRLERSFTGQSEFVGNVVHEMRTPLATLRLETLVIAEAAPRARIERQVDRLGHVITQLRHLALLDSTLPEIEAMDLHAIALDVVAQLAPRALDTGHTIALDDERNGCLQENQTLASPPGMAAGNTTLASLALTNLVNNAIDHTPPGTAIRVVVGSGHLTVEDDGPGITTSERAHLTRRYWRADSKRSDNAGIGLAIVHRIMELSGGELKLFPAARGGAGFILHFGTTGTQDEG